MLKDNYVNAMHSQFSGSQTARGARQDMLACRAAATFAEKHETQALGLKGMVCFMLIRQACLNRTAIARYIDRCIE